MTQKQCSIMPTSKHKMDVFTVSPERTVGKHFPTDGTPHVTSNRTGEMMNVLQRIQHSLGGSKLLVHFLVVVFAIASWVDLNGMWVELPLLVMSAPEQWTLPSYITIISQVANVGPIVFILISSLAPGTKPRLEILTTFIIIAVGVVACLLLAFFWEHTSHIGGEEHSTALLALNFFLAVGDCTSSLSFYAFMAYMKPIYMPSLLLGEGLSGMLPAMIALGQGAGEIYCVNVTSEVNTTSVNSTPATAANLTFHLEHRHHPARFTVQTYFIILSVIIACSGFSFFLLNFWSYCKTEHVGSDILSGKSGVHTSARRRHSSYGSLDGRGEDNFSYVASKEKSSNSVQKYSDSSSSSDGSDDSNINFGLRPIEFTNSMSVFQFVTHQLTLVVINMTFTSFLSTIQIYSTLPYGLDVYHLATTLVQIANPAACFLALFVLAESQCVIVFLTVLGEVCVGYIIYLAAWSPTPPLVDHAAGGDLTVSVWVLATLFLIYSKVCVASVMRKHGRNALIWAGISTQVGSLIGAIVGFLLVNQYSVFTPAGYC